MSFSFTKKLLRLTPKIILSVMIALFVVTSHLILSEFYLKNHLVYAAFNKQINYQGKLTNASNVTVADGTYHMMFALYTAASGGTDVWSEDRSTAPGDRITVTNGLFSVLLGSSTALTDIFNQTLYLGVQIGGSAGTPTFDSEMTPRKKLGAVPAAFEADKIDGLSSEQFLRSDATNSTTTASNFVTINQSGAGDILNLQGAGVSLFNFTSTGLLGTGTTTPW